MKQVYEMINNPRHYKYVLKYPIPNPEKANEGLGYEVGQKKKRKKNPDMHSKNST